MTDHNNSGMPGCNPLCPGCTHRHLTTTESLEQKEAFLKQKLKPWSERILPVRSALRTGYRQKVVLNVRWEDQRWEFGMIHRDELIEIPGCPVHSPGVNAFIARLAQVLPPGDQFPLAFYIQSGGQVTLVVKTIKPVPMEWLGEDTVNVLRNAGIQGLWIHYNPSAGRRLFEKTPRQLVWGSAWSEDSHGMRYGPRSFQQLIPSLYHQSLQEASDFLQPGPHTAIVDLYSGTGNSLKYWTVKGSPALGVELSGEAVECALYNVPGANILRGKCSERVPQMETWASEQKDQGKACAVYANPPRTGIEPGVLEWITSSLHPERIAYLSCSAGTLRKNLDLLTAAGYIVHRITPYDFFPMTRHVECLALAER